VEIDTSISDERVGLRALAFPKGWFQVCYSDEIAPGNVRSLEYFGQKLVLFRSEDGHAQVLDAFCPHLGAHLGHGGLVSGDHIVCPFHGWEYGVDGACARIPYNERVPSKGASIRVWPTEERSGIVMIWHCPEAGAPKWDPPFLPEYASDEWGGYFIRWNRQVSTIAHEIIENIVDVAHVVTVHRAPTRPEVTFTFKEHTMVAKFHNDIPSVGHKAINHVTAHGLGLVENRSEGTGEKAFFSAYTPIDEFRVDVWFSMLVRNSSAADPTGKISKMSARATISEFEKDIPIWENKSFSTNPLIVQNDGPIAKYRKWARRFFD